MADNIDKLVRLLNACDALGSWMSAALDDPKACPEFKAAASEFLDAHHQLCEARDIDRRSNVCPSSPN